MDVVLTPLRVVLENPVCCLPGIAPVLELLQTIVLYTCHVIAKATFFFHGALSYAICRAFPGLVRQILLARLENYLVSAYRLVDAESSSQSLPSRKERRRQAQEIVKSHFTPRYAPWTQRLCVTVDGQLFNAIARGHLTLVTGEIVEYTTKGLLVHIGPGESAEIPADTIVLCTGLTLLPLGGIRLFLTPGPEARRTLLDPGTCYTYRGVMLSGVPNFFFLAGFVNNSWTVRIDRAVSIACPCAKGFVASTHSCFLRRRGTSFESSRAFNPGLQGKLHRFCQRLRTGSSRGPSCRCPAVT